MVPIPAHRVLVTLVGLAGMFTGFALGIVGFEQVRDALPQPMNDNIVRLLLFGMLPGGLGYLLARKAFTLLVTATCPRCGGSMEHPASHRERAVLAGSTIVPVTYQCRTCGHVHRTKVSVSDEHHLP